MFQPNWEQVHTRPQLLSAYADGELDAATRAKVEHWLVEDEAARHEVEELQRLRLVARNTVAAGPDNGAWPETLRRIEAAAPPATVNVARRHGALLRWLTIPAAAAAILLAIHLATLPGTNPIAPVVPAAEDAIEIAADDDVEIISMDAGDISALVVGEPPHKEPLVLASATDVDIEDMESDTAVRWSLDGPMIVAVLPE